MVTVLPPADVESKRQEERKLIYSTALLIKREIASCVGISSRPLDVMDVSLSKAKAILPDNLYWLLRWIVSSESTNLEDIATESCKNASDERKIIMLAQDILHCSSHGKIKTPKHVSLGVAVRHLTGSKDLITLLNRMGHSSSFDEVQAIDTSLAKEINIREEEMGVVLPSNICPGSFVQLAADNTDLREETLDGKQTTHATTVVLYQHDQFGRTQKPAPLADHSKRQRALKRQSDEYIFEFPTHGKRPVARNYAGKVSGDWFLKEQRAEASRLDFAWVIL